MSSSEPSLSTANDLGLNGPGLDTLRCVLSVEEAQFDNCPIDIQISANVASDELTNAQLLYYDQVKGDIYGKKAYLNNANFKLDIVPDRTGYQFGAALLWTVSAASYADSNLVPMDEHRVLHAVKQAVKDCEDLGCLLPDLTTYALSRVDLTQNFHLKHPVKDYEPLFRYLGMRARTKKHEYGGTGFMVGNKQWSITAYDKIAQMKAKKLVPPSISSGGLLRVEIQAKNAKAVKLLFGGKKGASFTVHDLCAMSSDWPAIYRKKLDYQLFSTKPNFHTSSTSVDPAALVAMVKAQNPKVLLSLLANTALWNLLIDVYGFDGAKSFVEQELCDLSTESGKKKRSRYWKELEAVDLALALQKPSPSGSPLIPMYEELRSLLTGWSHP